jgi:hypothetical protein
MVERGDKESTRVCLDIGHLFLHTVPKVVQTFVITYDEILHALAVEDLLLQKPLLYLGLDTVVRWKALCLVLMFF